MKLTKEQDMPLLARKRLTYTIDHLKTKTPTRLELRKEVAKQNKTKEECVTIRHVHQQYGKGVSKVIAHVYTDAEVCKKLDFMRKKDQEHLKKNAEPAKEGEKQ